MRDVSSLGIASALTPVSNGTGNDLLLALYAPTALQGSGAFLKVTYDMPPDRSLASPFFSSLAASATEAAR